jgi:hypothetical protein
MDETLHAVLLDADEACMGTIEVGDQCHHHSDDEGRH